MRQVTVEEAYRRFADREARANRGATRSGRRAWPLTLPSAR